MKKFSFLLALLVVALIASSQNKKDLQNKIQLAHEKISKISQRARALSKLSESQTFNAESLLKSAATQKLDSTVNWVWNVETQVWQNDYKEEFSFDSEMKYTSYLDKQWNSTSKSWDAVDKIEMKYDNQNRINSMLTYQSDSLTLALTPIYKLLFLYNSDGIQDSTFWYSTKTAGTSWFLILKQIDYFNAAKQLTKRDNWLFDEGLGLSKLVERDTLTYTSSGKILTSSINYFSGGNEFLNSKTEFNYDGSDKLSSIENSERIYMTYTLEKSSRSTYQYNALGDLSVENHSTWNGTSWVENDKDEYLYSTTNFSELVFPSFPYLDVLNEPKFSYIKAISGINSSEMLNGSWKNTTKSTNYYSGITSTNINEFEKSVISVFPNPASESINFSWEGINESLSLGIYQMTGAKVIEQLVYSGRTVSISNLENGVYLYRLLNGQQQVKMGKLIKR